MTPESLSDNEQDYIDGLLHHNPDVINSIYQKFAVKAQRFIQQKGGSVRDAAHIFEEVLLDIYFYVRRHPLQVSSFDAFLILLSKRVWEKEVERRGQRIPGLEADETATLGREDMIDLEDVLKEGEKRRMAYHQYLQLDDSCKEVIKWALTDCLQSDIAAELKIPVAELPARRADCFHRLFRNIDGALKTSDAPSETEIGNADAYLSNFMNEADKKAYADKLRTNITLSSQVKRFDLIRKLLAQRICTDTDRDELQHQLYAHRNAWFSSKDTSVTPIRNYIIGVAILAIGLATMLYISPWRKNIYSQFSSTEMQAFGNDSLDLPQDIMAEFNRGHFSDALQHLNAVLEKNPENIYARYFRGVCLVDLNQIEAARKDLLMVYNGDNKIRYEAAFYIALSYLKEGHKQECLDWLVQIPEGAPNYIKVQKLIEELKG
ncbi:DNA-directed RNA polymerase specialized sigma24 family protein [Chitinophaga dinghuensis]|uniref:DNA-directed RNA polymerase specialized sigma24 family protein n=1 Tax=Chitinophaga dinghuensis TaxID=1539050 RepID=A0A327WAW7_9BACT|nr:tetratricopeptide repeat protein [Chitinophaga dinghuensis]RAJ87349.1 DNA-directed RNA polymerase specialized sigma24 family protein [Chitinophaga dinghuensis]